MGEYPQNNNSPDHRETRNTGSAHCTKYQTNASLETHSEAGQDMPTRILFVFPNIVAEKDHRMEPRKCVFFLAEPLEFPSKICDIVLTVELIYKLPILYGPITAVMCTATCFFDTEAEVHLIRSSMIPNEWRDCMKLNKLLTLQTSTKNHHR